MKRETKIGGKSGSLSLDGANFLYKREDGTEIKVSYSVEFVEPGIASVLISGRSYRVTRGSAGEMLVNGRPLEVEVFDPRSLRGRKSAGATEGRHEIRANMPGKIVRVLVSAGDAVEAGQGLVVVEAMKMQNEMKSPKTGRVVEVKTHTDAAVSPGEILMVVE